MEIKLAKAAWGVLQCIFPCDVWVMDSICRCHTRFAFIFSAAFLFQSSEGRSVYKLDKNATDNLKFDLKHRLSA